MGKQGKRINENEDRIREKKAKTLKIKDNIRETREKRQKTVGNGGWDKGKEKKSRKKMKGNSIFLSTKIYLTD